MSIGLIFWILIIWGLQYFITCICNIYRRMIIKVQIKIVCIIFPVCHLMIFILILICNFLDLIAIIIMNWTISIQYRWSRTRIWNIWIRIIVILLKTVIEIFLFSLIFVVFLYHFIIFSIYFLFYEKNIRKVVTGPIVRDA